MSSLSFKTPANRETILVITTPPAIMPNRAKTTLVILHTIDTGFLFKGALYHIDDNQLDSGI